MRSLLTISLILCSAAWALAQSWATVPQTVVPGKSLGFIQLGKPIPPAALKQLGQPRGGTKIPANVSKDGAAVEWSSPKAGQNGPYIRVKCHDGVRPENVFQIFSTAPGPRTASGVGVGTPVAEVLKKYPHGKWERDELEGFPTWDVPGLSFVVSDQKNGKVVMLWLHNAHSNFRTE